MIDCPICDSKQVKPYLEKNHCFLHRCLNCSLVFVWPIPDRLSDIYQERYFHIEDRIYEFGYADYEKDKEAMGHIFQYYLNLIEAKIAKGGIFDVGAATGYFLNLAKERGWRTAGIDISDYAVKKAAAQGHDVSVGNLISAEVTNKFEAVTLWDVFEHLDDPKAYLKKINQIMISSGILALNTINRGSWWARFWGRRWHLIIPPEHLFYYNERNLKKVLFDGGFEILAIKKIGKYFSVPSIFKMLYFWQKLKLWQWLYNYSLSHKWLRGLNIPINLRDNIFILARKVKD